MPSTSNPPIFVGTGTTGSLQNHRTTEAIIRAQTSNAGAGRQGIVEGPSLIDPPRIPLIRQTALAVPTRPPRTQREPLPRPPDYRSGHPGGRPVRRGTT